MYKKYIFFTSCFALLIVFGLSTSCGNPCEDLGNKICACESNQTNVDGCKLRFSNDTRKVSKAEQQRCSDFIDTCTCAALACGDLAACGLAKDTEINIGTEACQ